MPLPYPENVIWYIEASRNGEGAECTGSAVAILLREKLNPSNTKVYLLTCAHVVRGISSDGKEGYGTLLSEIVAWSPESAHVASVGKSVRIATTIWPVSPDEIPSDKRANAANDWVVLEFANSQFAETANPIRQWANSKLSGGFCIIGYPGGEDSFPEGMVIPTRSPDSFQLRHESFGVVELIGDGTRPGISGGGLFSEQGDLFSGIHRQREHDTLQVHALSAAKIFERLGHNGYEPVPVVITNGLERDISRLTRGILTASAAELKTIRFEVEELMAKHPSNAKLRALEERVKTALEYESVMYSARLPQRTRVDWMRTVARIAAVLMLVGSFLSLMPLMSWYRPSSDAVRIENVVVSQPIKGETILNDAIDELLLKASTSQLNVVLTADTNSLRQLGPESRYLLISRLEGVQLEVAAAVFSDASDKEVARVLSSPPGLTTQAVQLTTANSDALENVVLRLVIGVKLPESNPLGKLPELEQFEEIKKTLEVQVAP